MNLSINTDEKRPRPQEPEPEETQRRKTTRDGTLRVPTIFDSDDQSKAAWEEDVSHWKDIVCKVWDGTPRLLTRYSNRRSALMSPLGDWRKRQYEASAKLTRGMLYGKSCRLVHNTYGFDPNGIHRIDMLDLEEKLKVHYNRLEYPVPFVTLPAPTATTQDIQAWVDKLDPPLWANDKDDAFQNWKDKVRLDRNPVLKSGEFSSDGVGRIEYKQDGEIYVGETLYLDTSATYVPNGLGILTFGDGSTWRGRWDRGTRTKEIGAFTETDGVVTLGTWPQSAGRLKSTTRLAVEELTLWNDNHMRDTWTDRFLVEKPGYGAISVAKGNVGGVLRIANWHTEAAIKRMMTTTNPTSLGVGRDTLEYISMPRRYTKLLPLAVFDVDYSNSYVQQDWIKYQGTLETKLAEPAGREITGYFKQPTRVDRSCPVSGYESQSGDFVDSNLASIGIPLQTNINEKFLLHAPNVDNLFAVLNTSFDVAYSRGGLFGSGIYFADDPGKSDQYARPSNVTSDMCKRLGLDRERIRTVLKNNAAVSDEKESQAYLAQNYPHLGDTDYNADDDYDVFFMYVCRVPLGNIAAPSFENFQLNMLPEGDKAEGDRKLFLDAEYPSAGDVKMGSVGELQDPYTSLTMKAPLRYREFIVYKNAVARVSHLIAYCRARERSVETNDQDEYQWPTKTVVDMLQQDGTAETPGSTIYRDPFGE